MKKTTCLLLCCLLVLSCVPAPAEGGIPAYMPCRGCVNAYPEDGVLTLADSSGRTVSLPMPAGSQFFASYDDNGRGCLSPSLDGQKALVVLLNGEDMSTRNRLFLYDGGEIIPVSEDISWNAARLSNDGSKALFSTSDGLLYLYIAKTGESVYIAEDFFERFYGFSADGDKAFYTRMSWSADGAPLLVGCLFDCDTGAEEVVVENGILLSVSDDDACLLYYALDMEEEDFLGIYALNRATGSPQLLSEDDDTLVYTNLSQNEFFIMIDGNEEEAFLSLDGSEPVKIASDETRPLLPYGTVLDSGSYPYVLGASTLRGMYFTSRTPDGLARVIRITEDGMAQTVVQGVDEDSACLLSDGRTLLVLKNGGVRRVDGLNPAGAPDILVSGGVTGFVPAADGSVVYCLVYSDQTYTSTLYAATPAGETTLVASDLDGRLGTWRSGAIYGGRTLFFAEKGVLWKSDGGAAVQALAGEGSEFWNVRCSPFCVRVLDYGTAAGESSIGATIMLSWDGETFVPAGRREE